MTSRPLLAVMHYDGAGFVGWQRQPQGRTVQAEVEAVLERLTGQKTTATGAGRTDSGVHALGQGVGFTLTERWAGSLESVQRALNALLPRDIWVERMHAMQPGFHARRSATARRYRYVIGTDEASRSPFRRPYEWALGSGRALDVAALGQAAAALQGEHEFRGLARAAGGGGGATAAAAWGWGEGEEKGEGGRGRSRTGAAGRMNGTPSLTTDAAWRSPSGRRERTGRA